MPLSAGLPILITALETAYITAAQPTNPISVTAAKAQAAAVGAAINAFVMTGTVMTAGTGVGPITGAGAGSFPTVVTGTASTVTTSVGNII